MKVLENDGFRTNLGQMEIWKDLNGGEWAMG